MPLRIFISYKSHDGDIVRFVAAWLRHNGVDCWFAEDQVPLEGQEDRGAIVAEIAKGIAAATHVLFFTNRLFEAAPWCQVEFRLAAACGLLTTSTAAEVRVPHDPASSHEQEAFERLCELASPESIPFLEVSHSRLPDLGVLHKFLMVECGWPLPARMLGFLKERAPAFPTYLPALGLTIDLPGWRAENLGNMRQGDDFEMVQNFVRDVAGTVRLDISTNRYARSASPFPEEDALDDIQLRSEAYAQARKFRDDLPRNLSRRTRITGVHRIYLGNRSHFGISYLLDVPRVGRCAARKYVLVAWDDTTRFHYEFVLTFHVYGSMDRLIALSPVMDAAVHSFGYSAESMETFRLTNAIYLGPKGENGGAEPHPLSQTSGQRLSAISYPAGHFEQPPPQDAPGLEATWLSRLWRRPKVTFSQLSGWHRKSTYVKE